MENCPNLEVLGIDDVPFTDLALDAMVPASVPRLRHVNFSFNEIISEARLLAFIDRFPGLSVLQIDWCGQAVSDAVINRLADKCKGLTSLGLCYCRRITNASVINLSRQCRGLTVVNLSSIPTIGDAAVHALTERADKLEVLWLSQTAVTDASIVPLVQKHSLSKLSISKCTALTDVSANAIALHCKDSLQTLNIKGCTGFSESGAITLVKALPIGAIDGITTKIM